MTDNAERRSLQVVLVDEGRPLRIIAERPLSGSGHAVVALKDGDAPMEFLTGRDVDVVRLDLNLDSEDGDLHLVRGSSEDTDVVVVGDGQGGTSVEFGDGYGYLTRPLDSNELKEMFSGAAEGPAVQPATPRRDPAAPVLGGSAVMRKLWATVERVAVSSASVLVRGETGTGKTLVARGLHDASPRRSKPFVVINCSAFQDQLLESELFGHEKGAFTGAASKKQGLFEVADRGTLFLDEVAEMSPAMQAKLLHVLDTGELRRVGGTRSTRVDTRLVAATNKNLEKEVEGGRFRQDLLFRLNVVTLNVPPLRERKEEIPLLVDTFLQRFRLRGRKPKQLDPEALALLQSYSWPGNVRELANTIEGLVLLSPDNVIGPDDLPPNLRSPAGSITAGDSTADQSAEPLPIREIERIHILRAMRYTGGKKAPAARLLGIDVKTLTSKLKSFDAHP